MVRLVVVVRDVRGRCAAGYKPGKLFELERFYIKCEQNVKICVHALNALLTFAVPMLKGVSARDLGIGLEDDVGFVQCPDPGGPYTEGGSVLFELRRTSSP